MKRLALAVCLASLAALCTPGLAAAADGGPYDFVSGAIKRLGLRDSIERHFILSAHNGPQGPNGQYQATYGKGPSTIGYKGTVTCVNVVGALAKVGIRITQSTHPEAVVGTYEILGVTDSGVPGEDANLDTLSPGDFSTLPPDCAGPYPFQTPTYAGNFTVHDAG